MKTLERYEQTLQKAEPELPSPTAWYQHFLGSRLEIYIKGPAGVYSLTIPLKAILKREAADWERKLRQRKG